MTSEHHPAGPPYRTLAERGDDTARDRLIASIEFALRMARTKDLSSDDVAMLEEHLLARADVYANERRRDARPRPPPLPPPKCHVPVEDEPLWPVFLVVIPVFMALLGFTIWLVNWAITVKLP